MKKRTKRCIAFILALMIVITGMPAMVAQAADDFNAGKAVATPISLNQEYQGTRVSGDAQEWYQFTTPDYNAFYKVTYKNINIPTWYVYFKLYDSDGAVVSSWSNDSGIETTRYFKLKRKSTYYLQGFSQSKNSAGNYKFSVSPISDVEDEMKKAGTVKTGQWYTSTLIRNQSEGINDRKDQDWYKIKNTTSADYLNFTFKNINGDESYLIVYDADGAEVDKLYLGKAQQKSLDIPCKSNKTYYICVRNSSWVSDWTDYKFKVDKVNDASRVKSKAQTIKLKKNYKYKINGIGDVDYYKIKLSKTGKYAFALKDICEKGRSTGLTMKVYNSKGKKVATVNGYNKKTVTKTVKNLKKGTYYIRISGDSSKMGNYTFNVKKK